MIARPFDSIPGVGRGRSLRISPHWRSGKGHGLARGARQVTAVVSTALIAMVAVVFIAPLLAARPSPSGVAVPLPGGSAWAQAASFRIGVLTPGGNFEPALIGLKEGLNRHGYKVARDFTFAVVDTKGALSELDRHANTVLATKPDVLVTVTRALAIAAKKATGTVPVIFTWVSDPVQLGLIASYSSSGNNFTGVTGDAGPLSGKRLEILKEVAPGTKNVLAVVSVKEPVAQDSVRFLEEAATKLKVKVVRRDVTTKGDLERALAETPKGSFDAIYHIPSTFVSSQIDLLINKAKADKLPLVAHEAMMAERGALLTYGPDLRLTGAQAARLVAKILKGEKPSEIPTETPEKLLFVVNMTTAKSIGLKIPRNVLERIDRVVE
jgi:putative tryptophan/tyrosine transport system substrate-binding protein